jgi:spoIIIJ-associated protein
MIKEIIATGKDVAEAQATARQLLGASELDDVKFEIIYLGRKGFMGFGSKPAQVKAYIEIPDKEERRRRPERQKKEKSERPHTEKVENANVSESANESDAPEKEEAQNKPNPNKKKKNKKPQSNPNRESQESKPKSQVIPERELKFERREVAEGEDMSYDFIRTVILDIGINATAELYSCDDGTRRITIKGEDASSLIGHHGDTLDALQYLANLASAKKNIHGERDKTRVTLDIEGYRAKREETLRALARRMAQKALKNRRSVMLEPMSAYERRIIHSEIQGIEGVSTNSIGSDNNRKIVIFLTDKKPKEIFEEDEKKTMLSDEFAPIEDEIRIDDIDTSVASDLQDESETVSVKQTYPDESESVADVIDDSDIK